MVKKFKLKHLIKLENNNTTDYIDVLKELENYKPKKWFRKDNLQKCLSNVFFNLHQFRKIDLDKLSVNESCNIKYPKQIGNIPFIAMMTLISLLKNEDKKNQFELIVDIISTACFKEHTGKDFDYDDIYYKYFKKTVENSYALPMIGLSNVLIKQLEDLMKNWQKMFAEVEVVDNDLTIAGGDMLKKFNIINSIKNICNDFNLPYEKAIQLPYSVVQTNSLANATSYFIQDRLSKIKEKKMRTQKGV